jgi:esterase/lipase superfamily enzyme
VGSPTRMLAIGVVALTLICGGCSNRPSQGVLIPVSESAEGTSRVPVLAVTTRRRSTTDAGEMFSGERAEEVSFAAVTVSIPPDNARKIGEIQWPSSPPGDPRRDFVTVLANYIDKPSFNTALVAAAKQARHGKVLVFVHGFNNRFDDAVYRFAQIAHDSKAQAIPVLFTWPSRGEVQLRAYTYDRDSATYSRDALEQLLDTLAHHPSVTEVTILAHSMGNWVTLEALRSMSIRSGRIGEKIKNVMLVAPDVDVDIFRTQIIRMGTARPRFELFVSQDDKALALSQFIWGGIPRLGEVDPNAEPYHSEFERQRIIVFDLTKLKSSGDDAHDRAFEDITSVSAMVRKRLHEGQQMVEPQGGVMPSVGSATAETEYNSSK